MAAMITRMFREFMEEFWHARAIQLVIGITKKKKISAGS